MFKKILGFLLLPILFFSMAPLMNIEKNNFKQENTNYKSAKSNNDKNHEMIVYNNSENWAGEQLEWEVELDEKSLLGEYNDSIEITGASVILKLKDGITFSQFDADLEYTYITFYDATDDIFTPIKTFELIKNVDFYLDPPLYDVVYDGAAKFTLKEEFWFLDDLGIELEHFHDYAIGFNVNKGDDLRIYSNTFSREVPTLNKLDIVPDEEALTINYIVSPPISSNITYSYNELYFEINKKRYDITEQSGQLLVEGLKPAKEYDIIFGYDVDKSIGTKVARLSNEEVYSASTSFPSDYSFEEGIIISSMLLIILLIIFLILILMIIYWNYQRRKISDLALVVGEDTKEYEPIYQYNNYQEEQGYNNQDSIDRNNEVYGYFDEVQDNHAYQDEEVAGYFDEVYDDDSYDIDNYEDGEGVYDIDANDEGEWY